MPCRVMRARCQPAKTCPITAWSMSLGMPAADRQARSKKRPPRRRTAAPRGITVPVRRRQVVKAAPVQQQIGARVGQRETQHVSQDEPGNRICPGCPRTAAALSRQAARLGLNHERTDRWRASGYAQNWMLGVCRCEVIGLTKQPADRTESAILLIADSDARHGIQRDGISVCAGNPGRPSAALLRVPAEPQPHPIMAMIVRPAEMRIVGPFKGPVE